MCRLDLVMLRPRAAVVGDYNPANHTHTATDAALGHAGVEYDWISTIDVEASGAAETLGTYAGVFIAPSSPYRSMAGALEAIRFARERGVPLVAT
jgi:CTP synthase (UTP-ammonia lyase)